MRKLGILGGMSWESTITYYKVINEMIGQHQGGNTSADMIIRSLDLARIDSYQSCGRWDKVAEILCRAAGELEQAGADFIIMASNTVHKVYNQVQESVSVPVLHIADATARAIKTEDMSRVGLIGTRYTMEGDFLKDRLTEADIEVIVPSEARWDEIHKAIFEEACIGEVRPETKVMFRQIIEELGLQGAEGVILGCTELGLLVELSDSPLRLFDTAVLHAQMAATEIMK